MPAQTGLFIDASDFIGGLDRYVKKYPAFTADAMWMKVGPRVIEDAITKEPYAPHLWGELWKSQRILRPVVRKKEIYFFVGFNIIYATYQHEGLETWHYTLTGSGPKYLEIKLERYAAEYLRLIAEYVNEQVGAMR